MKRLVAIGIVLVAAAVAYLLLQNRPAPIALVDATATATSDDGSSFMIGMTIENSGPPDELLDVSSPSGVMMSVMNPVMPNAALVVPGDSSAALAMDGAHLMMGADAAFDEGAFLPITLTFRNAGVVSTRVENVGAMTMDHTMAHGVQEEPAPQVEIAPVTPPSATGFDIDLTVTNFTFTQADDNAQHVPNEGHAHIYLNGLKLGRLYDTRYRIGALPPGDYVLTVVLNTNDHRPYLAEHKPVGTSLAFTLP